MVHQSQWENTKVYGIKRRSSILHRFRLSQNSYVRYKQPEHPPLAPPARQLPWPSSALHEKQLTALPRLDAPADASSTCSRHRIRCRTPFYSGDVGVRFDTGSSCHSCLTTSGRSAREKHAWPPPPPPPPPPRRDLAVPPAPSLPFSTGGAVLTRTKWLGSRLRTTNRSSSSLSPSVVVRASTRYGQAVLSRSCGASRIAQERRRGVEGRGWLGDRPGHSHRHVVRESLRHVGRESHRHVGREKKVLPNTKQRPSQRNKGKKGQHNLSNGFHAKDAG